MGGAGRSLVQNALSVQAAMKTPSLEPSLPPWDVSPQRPGLCPTHLVPRLADRNPPWRVQEARRQHCGTVEI